jgi:hypothetical protein
MTSVTSRQRRKDKRINSALRVDFATGPMEFACVSKTLSVGGIYITTPHPPPVDSRIWLRLHVDDAPDDFMDVEGVVRYVHPRHGMGVKFVDLKPADKKRIESRITTHWWQEV